MFGFVVFTGIIPKMSACLNVLGRSPELHAQFVPKQKRMGVQTVDASAVWRYALSMVVQSKHVCALLHQPEYQATAWHPEDLFHDRQPCSSLHLEVLASYHFQGRQASSVDPLSSRISAAASAGNATHAMRSVITSTKTGKRASQ